MTIANDRRQKDRIRERFTQTAEVFGNYAVPHRLQEAEALVRALGAGPDHRAVDLACGPGTLALPFARHVRWICGLDLTPAMLERALRSAAEDHLSNLDFALGDAHLLPFADATLDIAVTSYSLHHMPDPARVIQEMARVVKPGGRVGVIDICASGNPKVAEAGNRIERIRDHSHTRSLSLVEFERLFHDSGLRILAAEPLKEPRSFEHWMHVAGWKPGDAVYGETLRLIEATLGDNSAGFYPKLVPGDAAKARASQAQSLWIVHTNVAIAAEKM